MRLGVLVIRRFVDRSSAREDTTEVCRAVELGIPPVHGMALIFDDGSGECVVSQVRHHCGVRAGQGVVPVEVELRCTKEPAAGLKAALASGWAPVREPA